MLTDRDTLIDSLMSSPECDRVAYECERQPALDVSQTETQPRQRPYCAETQATHDSR